MNPKELFADDDAVSPVIGVILMVAITVILAAVIATFVLGLGDQVSNTAPQTSFSFDYESGPSDLTIIHDGGENVEAGELRITGGNTTDTWAGHAGIGDGSVISAGKSVTVGVSNSDTVRVVWEPAEGGSSATLAKWEGPDA